MDDEDSEGNNNEDNNEKVDDDITRTIATRMARVIKDDEADSGDYNECTNLLDYTSRFPPRRHESSRLLNALRDSHRGDMKATGY